jgi:hypothetical protein
LYRGDSIPEARQYLSGDLHVGGGHGLGTNFSDVSEVAADYAERRGGQVVQFALSPKAKVIRYGDAVRQRDEYLASIADGLRRVAANELFENPGTFATARGYDAMVLDAADAKAFGRGMLPRDSEEWIVFNRTALTAFDDLPRLPDLEGAARVRQAVVDVHRGVADTLSEVAGLLDNEASARLLTTRAEAILARSTGEVKKALAPLVRAMKTGDPVKVERAITAAGRKLGLRRGSPAGEIVDYDRSIHGPIAGERIADGAKVRIVRPGYDATINGEDLRLSKAVVEPLSAAEIKDIERRALRAAARERNKFIESRAGTARLLAEVDELIVKGADKAAIAQRLNPALIGPEQPFAGADPAILEALRKALDTSPAALRSALTRATTKAKLKPVSKAGAKAKFDPDTMEPVSGVDIPAGAPVTVVTRGTSVTLPDGTVLQLSKARVTVVPTKPARTSTPSRNAETADDIMTQAGKVKWHDLESADWQRAREEFQAKVAAVFDGDFAGVRVKFDEGAAIVTRDRLTIEGELVDAKTGRKVGAFTRTVSRDSQGRLVAYHSDLEIIRNRQGSGIAEEFNQNLFDWYRRSGIKRVELSANIDVGGYAWATKGFDFVDPFAAQEFVSFGLGKIEYALRRKVLPKGVDRAQLEELRAYLQRVDSGQITAKAFDISQFGRQPGQGGKTQTWAGKWLMLGSSWDGVLIL